MGSKWDEKKARKRRVLNLVFPLLRYFLKELVFMESRTTLGKVAMYVTRGCLIVPVQLELHDDVLLQMQEEILENVNKTGVRGVIIDVSGVAIMDSFIAQAILDTAKMASLLGARTVITGIRPGVAAALIDLGFKFENVLTAISLEEGFRLVEPVLASEDEYEEVAERNVEEEDETTEDENAEEQEQE
jgi:rsbT antagonist protein RsbS